MVYENFVSASPAGCSPHPRRTLSPRRTPGVDSPDAQTSNGASVPKTVLPHTRVDSQSPTPQRSDADVSLCNAFLGLFFALIKK